MNDFKELKKPKVSMIGNEWYVATITDSPQGWLDIDGNISVYVQSVYYKSELKAHRAACAYYHSFHIGYPYIDRLCELKELNEVLGETAETNDFESQVMVFE